MARRSVAEFLEQFVLPLVAGGEVRVTRPLSVEDIGHFEEDLPHASEALVAVDEARAAVLSEIVVRPPALILDVDELWLAAAVHNLLFLVHPRADSWVVTNRARTRLVSAARHMARRPLTTTPRRVLARHAMLHNVFDLTRIDTKVTWWTGSARFLGQKPPGRLTAWRGIRRVREETQVITYEELLTTAESAPVMAALLRRSPLTQLLATHPQAPALHWEDAVFLLRDPQLARAVSYAALRPGDPAATVAAPARYAAAFEQMLERVAPAAGPPAASVPAADVRAVAAFLVHLNALLALSETRQHDLRARSALLATVLAPERAGSRPRGLSTFFALPDALAQVDPRLAHPPGLAADPRLHQRWDAHRAQVAEQVGEAVIATLATRLGRALTPAAV